MSAIIHLLNEEPERPAKFARTESPIPGNYSLHESYWLAIFYSLIKIAEIDNDVANYLSSQRKNGSQTGKK